MVDIYKQSVEDAIDKLKFSVKAVTESLILNAEFADELIEKPVTSQLMTWLSLLSKFIRQKENSSLFMTTKKGRRNDAHKIFSFN